MDKVIEKYISGACELEITYSHTMEVYHVNLLTRKAGTPISFKTSMQQHEYKAKEIFEMLKHALQMY